MGDMVNISRRVPDIYSEEMKGEQKVSTLAKGVLHGSKDAVWGIGDSHLAVASSGQGG